MTFCPNCGNENRETARFCRTCGQALAPGYAPPGVPDEISAQSTPDAAQEIPVPAVGMAAAPVGTPERNRVQADSGAPSPEFSETAVAIGCGDGGGQRVEPDPAALPVVPMEDGAAEASDLLAFATIQKESDATCLQGRYRLFAPLVERQAGTVLAAEDTRRCSVCLTVQETAGEQFCQECGLELKSGTAVQLHLLDQEPAADSPVEWFQQDGLYYQVEIPALAVPVVVGPSTFQLVYGYLSDTGRERETNEDSLMILQMAGLGGDLYAPPLGLVAVADGIGGYAGGEIASRTALQSLANCLLVQVFQPVCAGQPVDMPVLEAALLQAVQTANRDVLHAGRESTRELVANTSMGCTLTAALIYDRMLVIANVGDSRAYLMHAAHLTQLTRDHSMAALLVEKGLIRPEEVFAHMQKHTLYRSLGDLADLQVDIFRAEAVPGDCLLLCSDGLWDMLNEARIEEVLLECFDPQSACNRLVDQANQAGGEDNISVILVKFQTLSGEH